MEKTMTIKEAIAILHPDTSKEAISEYAYFHHCEMSVEIVNEACLVACECMKEVEKLRRENFGMKQTIKNFQEKESKRYERLVDCEKD